MHLRILIADDEFLVRLYLRQALSAPDIEVVAEAGDGHEAVDLAVHYAPDVALLDLRMPQLSGIDAARQIVRAVPTTKLVALTASESEADLDGALRAGFTGYILKDEWHFLEDYVRRAHQGEIVLSPRVGPRFLELYRAPQAPADQSPGLTPAELAVLSLLAERLTYREIAARRYTTLDTVKKQVGAVYRKLDARGWREAVGEARKRGLLAETPTSVVTERGELRVVVSHESHQGFERYTQHHDITIAAFIEALGWCLDPSAWPSVELGSAVTETVARAHQTGSEPAARAPSGARSLRARLSHQAATNWEAFASLFSLSLGVTLEAVGLLLSQPSEWQRLEQASPQLKLGTALASEITARRRGM